MSYRSDRELRAWMAKDPIVRFRGTLVHEKILSEERADELTRQVQKAVEEAAAFAKEQPVPRPEDGLRHVFAEGSVPLHTS